MEEDKELLKLRKRAAKAVVRAYKRKPGYRRQQMIYRVECLKKALEEEHAKLGVTKDDKDSAG